MSSAAPVVRRRTGANAQWKKEEEEEWSFANAIAHLDTLYDPYSDTTQLEEPETEERFLETRGDFAILSTEVLFKLSSYLDLESLCSGSASSYLLYFALSPQLCVY